MIPRNRAKPLDEDYPVVKDAEAKRRLLNYARRNGAGPHRAEWLADVIWPGRKWRSAQGAGGAASLVLKRLGFRWHCIKSRWGWMLL